jgi:hypothetical protein
MRNENWRMLLMNELMELIFMTGSSNGLSENQYNRLAELYGALTPTGKEHIEIWAEENDRTIPSRILKSA